MRLKYAIKVPVDNSTWLYVCCHSTGEPVTFNSMKEAINSAKVWKKYEVVEYN